MKARQQRASNFEVSTANTLQHAGLALLLILALVALHEFIVHLRSILMPFVLSAFIVLAVEPTVSSIHGYLSGRVWPHRWFICCCRRSRRRYGDGNQSAKRDDNSASESSVESPSEMRSSLADDDFIRNEMMTSEVVSVSFTHGLDGFTRFLATLLVLAGLVLILVSFAALLARGAMHMRDNWDTYQTGVQKAIATLDSWTRSIASRVGMQDNHAATNNETVDKFRSIYTYVISKMQDYVASLLDEIVQFVYGGISTLLVVLLYVLFWLIKPLPVAGRAGALVRSYIWKKTFVSLLFGGSVAFVYYVLNIDLAILFGLIAFSLNFVPEIGAFISIVVPIPILLLDGRLKSPVWVVLVATLCQFLLKIVFSNLLEVKLIEQDREMSIHPVWVLLGLNYFGFVWGTFGMLMSVPILAMLKSACLATVLDPAPSTVVTTWAVGMLNLLEGRVGVTREMRQKWHRYSKADFSDASSETEPLLNDEEASPDELEGADIAEEQAAASAAASARAEAEANFQPKRKKRPEGPSSSV
eukprot:TRINITY_DN14060_c0_g1_i3.p1 TRINITY_DN14060_c0_g1~~TRINITY_DN14060_c0_g1_i3.p1  ORF type:complete len:529 (-),score=67.67 TRINITY_DN14060_c0_g1_i3:123-1709(-)